MATEKRAWGIALGSATRTGERGGVGIGEVAGARGSAKGQQEGGGRGSGETERGVGGRGGSRAGSGARGGPRRETGVAARRALTAAECGLAVPDVQAGGLPAGLPQGQVVLVVGRDPGRAQHGPQIQTQRQEDAHQPDQLQRGQHRHAHLLHAAARRSHAPGAAAGPPRGRRGRQAGPESRGPDLPRREAAEPPHARGDSLPRSSARFPPRREGGSAGRAAGDRVVGSRSDADPAADPRSRPRAAFCPRPLRPGAARLARSAPAPPRLREAAPSGEGQRSAPRRRQTSAPAPGSPREARVRPASAR